MKTLKYLGVILSGLLIFIACQKETSLETGFNGDRATGSLGSSSGQCSGIVVRGQYVRDSVVTDSNYVLVNVNFSSPGLYKIITETENGFSFYDSGYMINTGLQTLRLKAVGKPIATAATNFLVTFDTSFCSFSVPVFDTPMKQAAFVITSDTANRCSVSQSGTYKEGVALNQNTNTLTVQMNVTRAGIYNISTSPAVNGMTFSASGVFNSTGITSVVLRGSGTPVRAGLDTIRIVAGNTTCSYPLRTDTAGTTNPGTGPTAADSAWSFNQGTSFFHGPMDTTYFDTLPAPFGDTIAVIAGPTYATGDTSFIIYLPAPGGVIKPGTYNTNSTNRTTGAVFSFEDATNTIYNADPTTVGSNLTIVVTYDATNKIVSGTFTGTARSTAGASIPITNGKFKAKVE